MTLAPAPRGSSPELLRPVVAGDAGWCGVRAILADPRRQGDPELLDQLLEGRADRELELVRSKYKPARKLTAYYRVASTGDEAPVDLAVSWFADGHVSALRFPTDPDLPQLSRLSDPAVLAATVETFHERPRAGALPVVHTVRYRPGQRHVLMARSPRWPTVYVKMDRDDFGAGAVGVARFLASALERECPRAHVVEPLGHATVDRATLWWGANGRTATASLANGRNGAAIAALVGRVARAVHDSPTADRTCSVPGSLGVHDIDAEVAATLRAGEHIVALLPSVGRTYRAIVAAVLDELDRLPDEPATLIHGDLKGDNLLVDGGQLRVLDLDRARWGEPALDLAKFLADLRWSSRPADLATLEAAFRAGYGEGDPARWTRAAILAPLVQLRLAARRAALHATDWPMQVRGRVAMAFESFERARRQ